jgi:hypothetical protein
MTLTKPVSEHHLLNMRSRFIYYYYIGAFQEYDLHFRH